MLYAHFGVVQLFQSPIVYIENVLQCRFTGCDSQIGWVDVFLKNYSFFPALGAWVAIPFAHKFRGWRKVGIIVLIVLNTCFLCFTINRGTIIGFALSIVLLLFYALRTIPWKKKIGWIFVFIALCSLLTLLLPQHIKVRFAEMASEFNLFFTTGHDSGSVSIRLTIWKTLLGHANEFWLFGDGPIYATDKLWIYLSDAGYQHYIDNGYIYHSQYLTYFHHFGVIGLLFLPVALLYPIYAMIRYRQVSITLIGIIVLFFVALIDDRYLGNPKTAQLLFFIYFSFFQREKWRHVEA
ncbi:MAG: O-antigen ligase family protein [Prevotellaceae bacterium]|nr:O-antigen ligase family protein [Prevotellaceae bacterium]